MASTEHGTRGEASTVIHKTAEDWRVAPNLTDYEHDAGSVRLGRGSRRLRRHGRRRLQHRLRGGRPARRRARGRTHRAAVHRPTSGDDGALATRDMSYAELARLAKRFTNVLRSLRNRQGRPGLHPHGPVSGVVHHASSAPCATAAWSRRCSRRSGRSRSPPGVNIGAGRRAGHHRGDLRRKIAKIRDQLTSVRHIFIVDDGDDDDEPRNARTSGA